MKILSSCFLVHFRIVQFLLIVVMLSEYELSFSERPVS